MGGSSDSVRDLAAGYARSHRLYEWAGIVGAVICFGVALLELARLEGVHLGHVPLALVLAMAFADLVSGLVHWAFDTFGDVDTPILGKLAIRTFRHHHVDPEAITRHDFVETNGHNAALSVLLISPVAYAPPSMPPFLALFLSFAAVFVAGTSQLHKWAHSERPPRFVRLLQRAGLVLRPEAHAAHHHPPFDRAYCVTTGWLNPVLDRAEVFRRLERVAMSITGSRPRRE